MYISDFVLLGSIAGLILLCVLVLCINTRGVPDYREFVLLNAGGSQIGQGILHSGMALQRLSLRCPYL